MDGNLTPQQRAFNIDCMVGLAQFPDKYFDLLVTDPPYAVTQNEWDKPVDLFTLWVQLERVMKINGAMLFTSSQPFTTDLIQSNRRLFKYDLIWEKSIATGFLNTNRMPLRGHEVICVFYRKLPTYNPQKHFLSTPSFKKGNIARGSSNYGKFDHLVDIGSKDGSRYPRSVIHVPYENAFFDSQPDSGQKMIHPTQKPIALFQYLIRTYSNKGDKVLDCFMGSGSSRIAAFEEGREYTGYEIDPDYFAAQEKRFQQFISQTKMFA